MPQPATRDTGRTRRLLAGGSGLIALSAYAGAIGLATGLDPYLRHLTDRLPLRSPLLGGLALAAVVGIPHTVAAWRAWTGAAGAERAAVGAGVLLVGWIGAELVILREPSVPEALFAGAGLAMVGAGLRRRATS